MKKKILYFIVITIILLSPIVYWFWNWWGINIFKDFPSIERLRYIYSQDQTLLITTSINMGLYFLASIRIFFVKHHKKEDEKEALSTSTEAVQTAPENHFIQNVPINPEIHHDGHWKNMYDNPDKFTPAPTPAPAPANQESIAVNVSDILVQPQPQAQIQTEQTSVSTPVATPSFSEPVNNPNASQNNVIEINPVTVDDIFKTQINSTLQDIGYKNLGENNIEGIEIDFVSIADSDTLILGIINSKYGDIIANETSTDSSIAPSWFTNENKYNSPVWEVKNAAIATEKMIKEVLPEDSEIDIKPVVVIPNANVSNYEDMKAKWDEIGVSVVKFLNGSSLPNLIDVIPNKTDTEVLKSYQTFVETLMKYFSKKAKKNPIRKAG